MSQSQSPTPGDLSDSLPKKQKESALDLTYDEKDISVTSFEIKNDRQKELRRFSPSKTDHLESEAETAQSTLTNVHKNEFTIPSESELKLKPIKIDSKTLKKRLVSIFQKSDNPQELIQEIKGYKPFSKDMEVVLQNRAKAWKIRKYKNAIFYGELVNGQRLGKGIMLYENTSVYEGDWDTNLKHGKGIEITTQGAIYDGEYQNGKTEGYGVFVWPNGEMYDGQWKYGKKHGSGLWKGIRGESYIGEWVQGRQEGYGVFTWRHGEKYEGNFLNFLKHGQGKERFGNGDYYEGSYLNGKPNGYGEYHWSDGREYKGYFSNGFRHGKGVWKGGKSQGDTYDGEWANDKKCGYGVYKWKTGNQYKGNYFDDKREGYGEMFWINGNYYKGQWHKGVMHGEGVLTMPGKDKLSGTFDNGIFLGTKEAIEEENLFQPNFSTNLSEGPDSSFTILPTNKSVTRGRERKPKLGKDVNDSFASEERGHGSSDPGTRRSIPHRLKGLPNIRNGNNSTMNMTSGGYNKFSPILKTEHPEVSRERSEGRENICQSCKLKEKEKEKSLLNLESKINPRPTSLIKVRDLSADSHCRKCGFPIRNRRLSPLDSKMPHIVSGYPGLLTRHELAKWNVMKTKLQLNPKYYENLDDPLVCEKIRKIINPKVWYPTESNKVQTGKSVISGHMALFIGPYH